MCVHTMVIMDFSSFEDSVTLLVATLVPSVATSMNLLNYQVMVRTYVISTCDMYEIYNTNLLLNVTIKCFTDQHIHHCHTSRPHVRFVGCHAFSFFSSEE